MNLSQTIPKYLREGTCPNSSYRLTVTLIQGQKKTLKEEKNYIHYFELDIVCRLSNYTGVWRPGRKMVYSHLPINRTKKPHRTSVW